MIIFTLNLGGFVNTIPSDIMRDRSEKIQFSVRSCKLNTHARLTKTQPKRQVLAGQSGQYIASLLGWAALYRIVLKLSSL